MANTNSPNGFVPYRHLSGGAIRVSEYKIAAAYSTAIYKGDPVVQVGTSHNIERGTVATDVTWVGVFQGCRYVDAAGNQVFSKKWPGTAGATDIVAFVCDDPNVVFQAQASAVAVANIGLLARPSYGTGDDTTGMSGGYVDMDNTGTTGESFKVMRLIPRVDNEYGDYGKVEVMFAEHVLSRVVSGAGGV